MQELDNRGIGDVAVGRTESSARDLILLRYEKVAELLMIAGAYMRAIEMTWHAIDVEVDVMGGRYG